MKYKIYISVNNWFCGRDYPPLNCFKEWLRDDLNQTFQNDAWAKENKLCIHYGYIDMSQNYTISAPREWVEKNCPELLTDKGYDYDGRKMKYSDFVFHPEEGETMPEYDDFGMPFREYKEENFGCEPYYIEYEDEIED